MFTKKLIKTCTRVYELLFRLTFNRRLDISFESMYFRNFRLNFTNYIISQLIHGIASLMHMYSYAQGTKHLLHRRHLVAIVLFYLILFSK